MAGLEKKSNLLLDQILEKLFASFRSTFYKRRREIEKDEENSCKNQFSTPFPATFYGAENADLFEYSSTLLLVLLLLQKVEQNCCNNFTALEYQSPIDWQNRYIQEVSILVVEFEVICSFKYVANVFVNAFKILKHFHSKRGRFHSPIASEVLMLNSFLLSILLLTHLFFCGSRFKDYELGVITRCQALCHYCGDKNGLNRLAMEGSFQKKTPLLQYSSMFLQGVPDFF